MFKSEELEKICQQLQDKQMRWAAVLERFRNNYQVNPEKPKSFHQYVQAFSEIHLEISLEQIASDNTKIDLSLRSLCQKADGALPRARDKSCCRMPSANCTAYRGFGFV